MNREYYDFVTRSNMHKFVSEKTGWSEEKTSLELNMPKFGKKSMFIESHFDFSSLVNLNGGRPEKNDVAKFMTEKLGMDYERACMKLNMPSLKRLEDISMGSLRTFSPGEMLSMRGF